MLQISLEKRTARGQLRLYKSNAQAEDSPAMSATQHGTSSCSSPSHMREKQPIRASQCRCYQADDGGKTKLLLFASKSKTMSLSTPRTALLLRIFLVQTHEQHVVRHQRETSRGPREPLATWETQEPPERLLYAKPSSFPSMSRPLLQLSVQQAKVRTTRSIPHERRIERSGATVSACLDRAELLEDMPG